MKIKKLKVISMLLITLLVFASCKPMPLIETEPDGLVDNNTDSEEVIDETDIEAGIKTLTGDIYKVVRLDEGFGFYLRKDNFYYYGVNLDIQSSTFLLDIRDVSFEETLAPSNDINDPNRSSNVKSIDGYMSGMYYATKMSDSKTSIVFVDNEMMAHLDLLEVEHKANESIIDVQLMNDFNTVYYVLDDGLICHTYKHQLDTNETIMISDTEQYVFVHNETEFHVNRSIYDHSVLMDAKSVDTMILPGPDDTLYDLVISNGIVADPDTNTYKFGYNIGIIDDTIVTISKADLTGSDTLDATGLIVSPGFIDMLGFNMNTTVAKYKITDGVTTNMSLHGCTEDFDAFFYQYGTYPPYINYGGAIFAIRIRYELGLGAYSTPTEEQIAYMAQRVEDEILAGGVALAFSPEYYPGTTPEEIRAMMAVAAEYDIPTHFHTRYSSLVGEHTGIDGLIEVLEYAKELDARVQIMHLHSTGGTGHMEEALEMINEARAEGVDITFDIYPYDSWASNIDWQRYDPGWQERYDITYSDLQMAGTSERLTEETFAYYREIGGLCIAFAMDEDEMLMALSEPYAMVGSDGNIDREDRANNHFRGAGTFSRILGKYVRDENVFSLMDGIRKMTINAASHLENISEDMALRGRLQEGCIADITVFDYRTILDQSTPEDPSQESLGIIHVIVSGQIGLRDTVLLTNVHAGQAIKSDFAE